MSSPRRAAVAGPNTRGTRRHDAVSFPIHSVSAYPTPEPSYSGSPAVKLNQFHPPESLDFYADSSNDNMCLSRFTQLGEADVKLSLSYPPASFDYFVDYSEDIVGNSDCTPSINKTSSSPPVHIMAMPIPPDGDQRLSGSSSPSNSSGHSMWSCDMSIQSPVPELSYDGSPKGSLSHISDDFSMSPYSSSSPESQPSLPDFDPRQGDPRIAWEFYYYFDVTDDGPVWKLQQGYISSYEFPTQMPCPATYTPDGRVAYRCLERDCDSILFLRKRDLKRHFQSIHGVWSAENHLYCDYRSCLRKDNPFGRKDHIREHYREYHYEDLTKHNMSEKEVSDFMTARISRLRVDWWRCSKCLHRVWTRKSGYVCPCGVSCETERQMVRNAALQMAMQPIHQSSNRKVQRHRDYPSSLHTRQSEERTKLWVLCEVGGLPLSSGDDQVLPEANVKKHCKPDLSIPIVLQADRAFHDPETSKNAIEDFTGHGVGDMVSVETPDILSTLTEAPPTEAKFHNVPLQVQQPSNGARSSEDFDLRVPCQRIDDCESSEETESNLSDADTDWIDDEDEPNIYRDLYRTISSSMQDVEAQQRGIILPTLTPMKQELVDRIMKEFWIIFNQEWSSNVSKHTEGSPNTSTPADSPEMSRQGSDGVNGSGNGRKRPRDVGEMTPGDGDDGGHSKQPRLSKNTSKSGATGIHLACPYRKHAPQVYNVQDYRSCALSYWDSNARLKEHLYRRHRVPIHCIRCQDKFKTQEQLDTHLLMVEICNLRPGPKVEGINAEIEKKLRCRKKASRHQSQEEGWRQIYEILFPGEAVPIPYYEPVLEDTARSPNSRDLARYEEYSSRELPRLFRTYIEETVRNEAQPLEERILCQLVTLIQDCQDRVFASYRSNCALIGASPAPAATTLPSGSSPQHPSLEPSPRTSGFVPEVDECEHFVASICQPPPAQDPDSYGSFMPLRKKTTGKIDSNNGEVVLSAGFNFPPTSSAPPPSDSAYGSDVSLVCGCVSLCSCNTSQTSSESNIEIGGSFIEHVSSQEVDWCFSTPKGTDMQISDLDFDWQV